MKILSHKIQKEDAYKFLTKMPETYKVFTKNIQNYLHSIEDLLLWQNSFKDYEAILLIETPISVYVIPFLEYSSAEEWLKNYEDINL